MNQNSINFLRDSLTHHRDLKNGLDRKASFLLGISGVIFALSVGLLQEIQFLILAISSFLAAFLSILVIRSPFRRGVKKKFGLMCWWGFSDKSFEEYKEGINKVFTSEEKISHEYMREIWNLTNFSLKPKTKLLNSATIILISGFLIGFMLFFI